MYVRVRNPYSDRHGEIGRTEQWGSGSFLVEVWFGGTRCLIYRSSLTQA